MDIANHNMKVLEYYTLKLLQDQHFILCFMSHETLLKFGRLEFGEKPVIAKFTEIYLCQIFMLYGISYLYEVTTMDYI